MQRLTPIEWARAKEPITHLSMSSRGHEGRERMINWLVARKGTGWFYVHGNNFHFGSPLDATAFRGWLMSEVAA